MNPADGADAAARHPDLDGADRAELADIVAGLAPTQAGPVSGTGWVPGRPAEPRLGSGAQAWAAQLAGEQARGLLAQHPGLIASAEDVAALIGGLIEHVLLRLVGGDGDVPRTTGTVDEAIRQLIAIDVPFAGITRSVRLAHESVLRALLGAAVPRATSAAALAEITLVVTRSIDAALDSMAGRYAVETRRFSSSAKRAQQELIDALIAADPVDARVARNVLELSIDEHHRGFVISWAARSAHLEGRTLWWAAEVVRSAVGGSTVVRVDRSTAWVWVTSRWPVRIDDARLSAELGDAVRVGVGSSQPGAAGFRRTHLEAVAAHRFRHAPAAGVIDHARHALAILVSADRERARWFVEAELGELAVPSPRNGELLATLRCYFDASLRVAATAERLHIHRNTAIQRLQALEALLGHPVTERTAEVQSALSLLDRDGAWGSA